MTAENGPLIAGFLDSVFRENNIRSIEEGDIDTHGFAILNQFRTSFPSVNSFLMDRKTLMTHQTHWGMEKTPTTADLSKLTRKETLLYDDLRNNIIKAKLRLEQEFIDFSRVRGIVSSISYIP